jgi:hypothetical protein
MSRFKNCRPAVAKGFKIPRMRAARNLSTHPFSVKTERAQEEEEEEEEETSRPPFPLRQKG